MRLFASLLLAVCSCFFLANNASAHALTGELVPQSQSVTVQFCYSGTEEASYTPVKIYSPESADIEFQSTNTDMRGQVTFTPHVSGAWSVVINDGVGHKCVFPVEVAMRSADNASDTSSNDSATKNALIVHGAEKSALQSQSLFVRIFLGISILANIFLGLFWWRKRR